MAKTTALILSIIFVLLGLLGFVSNPLIGTLGIFQSNGAENWLHIIFGAMLFAAAYWGK